MINYLSLFSGIGAFEKAMINQDIPFELIGFSEIDKYAVKSYSAIHNVDESLNLGDITKIDEKKLPKNIDLITYGFPCQDISLAGKQQGLFNDDGTKTRSGLFFDALRIIEHTQPIVAVAENVKNLVGKKFNAQFQVVLASLEAVGYNNYWAVLNAKDYGIPQNRERVFIVSIRKDVDTGLFEFPKSYELKLRLKDILENVVDEKYFLSDKTIQKLIRWNNKIISNDNPDVSSTIHAGYYKMGGRDQQYIRVKEATKRGYAEAFEGDSVNLEHPNSKTRRGRVGKQIAQTLTTSCNQAAVVSHKELESLCLRRLTPKECFRLMGFSDSDFECVTPINSDTQLYKQAGNSIVVDVAEELLCMLFDEDGNFLI